MPQPAATAAVEAFIHLKELNLYGNKLSDDALFPWLAVMLQSACRLQDLNLASNRYTGMGLSKLAPTLPAGLLGLSLASNQLGCFGASELAIHLRKFQCLERLDVRGCEIGDDGVTFLAEAWTRGMPSLRAVLLSSNSIGDPGCEAVACSLDECGVEELVMAMGSITEAGAETMAACIPDSRITALDMSGNMLGDAGARAFATSLEETRNLRSLNLSQNDIGDHGARAMAQFLPVAAGLGSLELNKGRIGPDGALALAEAAALCKKPLSRLGLEENQEFGTEARAALAALSGAVVSPLRGAVGRGS